MSLLFGIIGSLVAVVSVSWGVVVALPKITGYTLKDIIEIRQARGILRFDVEFRGIRWRGSAAPHPGFGPRVAEIRPYCVEGACGGQLIPAEAQTSPPYGHVMPYCFYCPTCHRKVDAPGGCEGFEAEAKHAVELAFRKGTLTSKKG